MQSAPPWQPPANAPAWALGKTPEQILGIAQQLFAHIESIPATTPVIPAGQPAQLAPDEYITAGQLQQQAQQYVGPMMEAQAMLAWNEVKREYPDVLSRYGPEALQYWQRLPPTQRNLDGARMVVRLVQGNHFDELKAEAIRSAQQNDATFRSGSAAGAQGPGSTGASPLISEEVPEAWRKKAESLGLTVDDLKDFAKANGLTVQQYMDKYVKVTVAGGR